MITELHHKLSKDINEDKGNILHESGYRLESLSIPYGD